MRGAGLRSRWPRWPVTPAAVGVIIAGGAAAVATWPHTWWWLVVVTVAAAAVVPPALAALSQNLQRLQEIGRAARAGLQGTIGSTGLRLPTAGSADLEARVHQSVLPIPYIHRDEEDAIRTYLRTKHPVLLIGSSMVGKSKMAARVIIEEFSSWPVVIPDSKTAFGDLDAKDVTLQGSVIWLDDIDRLIGPGGITDGALRRLANAGNVIVGTIRARAYDQFQPSDQLRPPEWDVLSQFEHVFISRDLTTKEQDQLASAVADPEIRNRIQAVGLGEYVGAARQVAEALKLGAAGTDPIGYALVLAAADWRRSGMTRPITLRVLALLVEPYLDRRGQAQLADQDAFNAGLAWATREINPNVSLLRPAGSTSYIVYDYVLDLISAQEKTIPDTSWTVIMANADIPELPTLGYTAEFSYHRTETAIQAYSKAANSGHADVAPMAMVSLGALLRKKGDVQGAEDAFQRAIDSGNAEAMIGAKYNHGWLLQEQGDVLGAKDAFQKAFDSGDAYYAPIAVSSLGRLLHDQGDVQGAKDAFQKAIDSGQAHAVPMAVVSLGLLLEQQGDVLGAKDAYQKAIDSGHAFAMPIAANCLGWLLERQGDVLGAKDAYQKAIDSGSAQAVPIAANGLGRLLEQQGDVLGAKDAYQKAIDSGNATWARAAANNLARLLGERGDAHDP